MCVFLLSFYLLPSGMEIDGIGLSLDPSIFCPVNSILGHSRYSGRCIGTVYDVSVSLTRGANPVRIRYHPFYFGFCPTVLSPLPSRS